MSISHSPERRSDVRSHATTLTQGERRRPDHGDEAAQSSSAACPRVGSHAEWLAARKAFLLREKEFTRLRDQPNAERRRLPLVKIEPFKNRMGWTVPWYSSFGSDFNHDFRVTLDEAVAPVEHNYRDKAEPVQRGETYFTQGEAHGLSVFLRDGESVFHACSTYARGTEPLASTYNYLDLTPLGRQEDWEEPPSRSDGPFMHWVRHRDRYGGGPQASASCCGPSRWPATQRCPGTATEV